MSWEKIAFVITCHLTGNLNYGFTGRIPVILHNLRGYDSHLIMQGIGKLKDKKTNCIPDNTEKYISFSIDQLDFIDSLQFMNASLEKLMTNLSKAGPENFSNLCKHIDNDKVSLLLRKGVYPYDYMDCNEKFDERYLPPVECGFYSELNGEQITNTRGAWVLTVSTVKLLVIIMIYIFHLMFYFSPMFLKISVMCA